MITILRQLALGLIVAFSLWGCADHPVRHLSSDVSLVKVGKSTRQDVQTYLGEPDRKQVLSSGREEWVYQEEERSSLQNMYLIGGFFSGNGYGTIVITLDGDLVVASEYRTSKKKDEDLSQ